MNIAQEYTIGNTKVRIATDFCENKTNADIAHTLDAIARSAIMHINATTEKKTDSNT